MGYALDRFADDPATATCTAQWIARVLGKTGYGNRRLTTYLQGLVNHTGFPAPLPDLVGQDIVDGVTPNSRWLRVAVDKWLDDRLPPAAVAALHIADRETAAADMDAAAADLRLVQGGRR